MSTDDTAQNKTSPSATTALVWLCPIAIAELLGQDVGKGIKNGWPCIVEIRGTQGCALVGDPARAVGECRDVAKAQP